jgi:hypothetical protein
MSRRPMRRDREHVYQGQGLGQGGSSVTLFDQVLALSAGRPLFTSDNYAEVGGKVVAFIDHNSPARTLAQPAAGKQVLVPAPHADFAGAVCGTFVPANENAYECTTPGVVDFMHDGTGGEVFLVGTFLGSEIGVVCGSRGYSGRGFTIARFGGDGHIDSYVLNTANEFALSLTTALGAFAANVPTFIDASFALASTPDGAVRARGKSVASGNVLVPPDAGPSVAPLVLASAGTGNFTHMRWVALAFFPPLTPEQREIVHAWIKEAYGIRSTADLFAEVLTLAAGRPVFTADNFIDVGGKVAGFIDWNDPSHVLAQAASARQVATPLPHADFVGALCASFTAAQNYVSTRPTSQWVTEHDGVSSEMVIALTPTGAPVVFFQATAANASVAGVHLFHDGTLRHHLSNSSGGESIPSVSAGVTAVGTPVYLDIRHCAAEVPQWVVRNRGAVMSSGPYGAPPSAGPSSIPCELGARAGAFFCDMRWTALAFFPALNDTQRATVQQWMQAEYGIAA